MTADTAAMIMMNWGDTYKNEPKAIVSNGVYIPDDGVRWDKVTVDVPQGGGSPTVEKLKGLKSAGGYDFGEGYYADVCADIEGEISAYGVSHIVRDYNTAFVGTRNQYSGEVIEGDDIFAPSISHGLSSAYIRVYKDGAFMFAFTPNASSGYPGTFTKTTEYSSFSVVDEQALTVDYRYGWSKKRRVIGDITLGKYNDGKPFSVELGVSYSNLANRRYDVNKVTKIALQASYTYTIETRLRTQKSNKAFEFEEMVTQEERGGSVLGSIEYYYNYAGVPFVITDLQDTDLSAAVAGFIVAVFHDKYKNATYKLTIPPPYDFDKYLI